MCQSLISVGVSQVEALLASEDYGKDLASVNNLLKKHQLLEADISAHEVCNSSLKMALHVGHLYLRNEGPILEHLFTFEMSQICDFQMLKWVFSKYFEKALAGHLKRR